MSEGLQLMSGHLRAQTYTLTDPDDKDVVTLSLSGNNETPQRIGRLHVGFADTYPSEIEIEPGPNAKVVGNIVGQIMQWGLRTPDGTGRHRLTQSIVVDGDGGEYGIIDSTTNGGGRPMPLLINMGESEIYFVLQPDRSLTIQDRVAGKEVNVSIAALIDAVP